MMAHSVIANATPSRSSLVVLSSDELYVQRITALLSRNDQFLIEHLESSNSLLTHLCTHPVDIVIAEINADLVDGLMLPCWITELNASGRLQRVPHVIWTVQSSSTPGISSLRAGSENGWRTTLNGVSSSALTSHARLAAAAGIQVEIVTEGQPDQMLNVLKKFSGTEHLLPRRLQPEPVEQLLSEDDVVSVMATGEGLRVVLQPQYDLANRRVVGAEALIRWHHPRHGDVPPSVLIPIVNRLGLDLLLFSYIEKTVIEILSTLDRSGIDIPIAINASAHTLCASGLATRLALKMHKAGLPTARLKIELTEEMAADNELALSASITALRAKGFPVSLDDFGAGAATLALLSRMPFDEMKIDGALVRAVGQSPHSSGIIAGIVSLARHFNINLVTEGIEDIESVALLSRLGCNTGQGFALARPMERDEFLSLVAQ